ncbi:MAG TPA: sigma-70 family RNA polymerase sigma factor [Polyangiaceae bacterium]|nr:sigma-70 family RNA polymerase sigma factor [Polyangiaceae bacterium]
MEGTKSRQSTPPASSRELEELLESGQGLVEHLVNQVYTEILGAMTREDLRAYGQQGLLEAALRFDAARGANFRTFAYFRVRGAMIDGLRKMGPWSRRGYERIALLRAANGASQSLHEEQQDVSGLSAEQAAERLRKHMASMVTAMTVGVFSSGRWQKDGSDDTSPPAGRMVAVDEALNAEEQLADRQMVEWVTQLVDNLPHPENEVVRRFYIDGDNMDAIAQTLGRSRSWVSRVHTRALGKLAARLRRETRDSSG